MNGTECVVGRSTETVDSSPSTKSMDSWASAPWTESVDFYLELQRMFLYPSLGLRTVRVPSSYTQHSEWHHITLSKVGIGPIVGSGSSFVSGYSFARVWYMLKGTVQFTSTIVMHRLISLMDEKNWDKGLGS